ncbi:hypothetical protein BDF19DRAFT_497182 [Syncephalis fuscata]|nr:hypothetical protein BDF19DRAFT_497182 [Syncephalis fuscata]
MYGLTNNVVFRHYLSTNHVASTAATSTTANTTDESCGCSTPNNNIDCPFFLLKVAPTATRHQLKRAYYARCLESHPDRQATMNMRELPKKTMYSMLMNVHIKFSGKHQSSTCSQRTNGIGPFSAYSAFVSRHSYNPHDPSYRHDAGLNFNSYRPANGGEQHPPRYTSNERFRFIVLAIALVGAGVQYWRVKQQVKWASHRLNHSDMQASQALKVARQRAKELGWKGQKALLEERIAKLSK